MAARWPGCSVDVELNETRWGRSRGRCSPALLHHSGFTFPLLPLLSRHFPNVLTCPESALVRSRPANQRRMTRRVVGRMPTASGWNYKHPGGVLTGTTAHANRASPCIRRFCSPSIPRAGGRVPPKGADAPRNGRAVRQRPGGRAEICGLAAGTSDTGTCGSASATISASANGSRKCSPGSTTRLSIERLNTIQAKIQERDPRRPQRAPAAATAGGHALEREMARERIRAETEERAGRNVVYYLRRESDGMIKIGYSGGLATGSRTSRGTTGRCACWRPTSAGTRRRPRFTASSPPSASRREASGSGPSCR